MKNKPFMNFEFELIQVFYVMYRNALFFVACIRKEISNLMHASKTNCFSFNGALRLKQLDFDGTSKLEQLVFDACIKFKISFLMHATKNKALR